LNNNNKYILITEYIKNAKDLFTMLTDGVKTYDIYYIEQLVLLLKDAIEYLHQKKIAHRDLKLENVIYNDSNIKVIDFGHSCSALTDTLCGTHDRVGTEGYFPPERFNPNAYFTIDMWMKSDVYALGVICYELDQYKPENDILGNSKREAMAGYYVFPKNAHLGHMKSPMIRKMVENCLIPDPMVRPWLTDIHLKK
jgi:serine/threonine protein kinase